MNLFSISDNLIWTFGISIDSIFIWYFIDTSVFVGSIIISKYAFPPGAILPAWIDWDATYPSWSSVIVNVSNILKRFNRENIKIFRYGDDEFAILILNLDSADSVTTITDTIYEAFQMENISVSGGIAIFKEHSEQKNELLRFANMALHHSKKNKDGH